MSKKADFEKVAGKVKAGRKSGKYTIEVGDKKIEFESIEDLMHLQVAIQQLFDEEWKEIQEERKARGQKTYVEYRGGEVVKEY